MLLTYGTYGFWGVLTAGLAVGAFGGLLAGRWLTLLLLGNPLGWLVRAAARAYRWLAPLDVLADAWHLLGTGQVRNGR